MAKQIEVKVFAAELKTGDIEGVFEGWASVYGVVDVYGDRVESGAFTKTISERPSVPVFNEHMEPIGLGRLEERPEGLYIKGELAIEIQSARDVLALMKRGIKRGLSIGFQTVQDAVVDGVRLLREVKLWEISIVTFPALQSARVVSAKAELGLEQIRQIVHDEVRSLAEKQAEPKIDGPSEPHPEIATALQGAATFFKGVDNA